MPEYQSDALDQYFDALLRNPNAQPPPELDAETTALVKALLETKTIGDTGERVKDRVWSRVLFATYAPPDLQPTYSIAPALLPVSQPRRKQRTDVAFLAAAVFAVVCLSGLFIQHTDTARESIPRSVVPARSLPMPSLSGERFVPTMYEGNIVRVAVKESIPFRYYNSLHLPE